MSRLCVPGWIWPAFNKLADELEDEALLDATRRAR